MADIVKAMTGDINAERVAKIRAEGELLELELEKELGLVANLSDMELAWANVIVALRHAVKGSSMSQSEKEQCLKEIRASLTGDILPAADAPKPKQT